MRRDLERSVRDAVLGDSRHLNRVCVYDPSPISYSDVVRFAELMAACLRGQGVPRRARICTQLHHGLGYVAAILVGRLLDVSIVQVSPSLKPEELAHVLKSTNAFAFISTAEQVNGLPQSWRAEDASVIGDRYVFVLNDAEHARDAMEDFVIFTSGTTGAPKGVCLTDFAVSANAWGVVEYLGLDCDDRSIVYTPPGFVYALSQTLTHMAVGASLISYPHTLSFAGDLARSLADFAVTGIATNPTGLRVFRRVSGGVEICRSARYVMTGGQPINARLVLETRTMFPRATVINTYGTTETGARISCYVCPPDLRDGEILSVGHPITGTRIKIVDDRGVEVADGSVGSVQVSNPQLAIGYLTRDGLDDSPFASGWFSTGDIGTFDRRSGLVLHGRLDDVILVGHQKVGPQEVEMILESVPGVIEAAVVAVPHTELEQVAAAYLVSDPAFEFGAVELSCRDACSRALSSAKQPRYYFSVGELPHNAYGKLDRKALRNSLKVLDDD